MSDSIKLRRDTFTMEELYKALKAIMQAADIAELQEAPFVGACILAPIILQYPDVPVEILEEAIKDISPRLAEYAIKGKELNEKQAERPQTEEEKFEAILDSLPADAPKN